MADMRDVTNSTKLKRFSHQPKEVAQTLLHFLRHPIQRISPLPDWNWLVLLVTTVVTSIISGVIGGFIPLNPYRIAAGIILSPIVGLVMTMVMATFLYYYFQVFERRTCSLRKLYTLVLLAGIPFYIFQTISDVIWIITPVGFAFTALITVVGLVENFGMQKKRAIRLVATILVFTLLVWAWNRFDVSRLERSLASVIVTSLKA